MNANASIWDLPTARQMISSLREELRHGISVCLVIAQESDRSELRRALGAEIEVQAGLDLAHVDLADLSRINLSAVQELLGGSGVAGRIEAFLKDDSIPDVVLLEGFDSLPPTGQVEVVRLIEAWGHHSHTVSSNKSLCVLVGGAHAASIQHLHPDLRIQYRFVMGFPSAIEMQLLCRPSQAGPVIRPEDQWREALVASLTGNDVEMAWLLWQDGMRDMDEILCVLQDYAAMKSWQRAAFENRLKTWRPIPFGSLPVMPRNIQNVQLLAEKMTVYTPEYGEEIHPAGLALLENTDEIAHRIWRAQSALVLPIVDELRMRVFQIIRKSVRTGLTNGEIPEIGVLKACLDQMPSHSWERRQFYGPVSHARALRNKLAHLEILNLREYLELRNGWQKIRQMSFPRR